MVTSNTHTFSLGTALLYAKYLMLLCILGNVNQELRNCEEARGGSCHRVITPTKITL